MKHNFSDRIVFDRDTSQPRERFRGRRFRFEEQKSSMKLYDSTSKFQFKSLLNTNPEDDKNVNNNNKDNDKSKLDENDDKNGDKDSKKNGENEDNENENNNSKLNNEKTNDENSNNDKSKNNNNDNNNSKETQNAFVQVNFLKEIIEEERKKIISEHQEKENEMKFKISDLHKNIQANK